jgi:polar amino acid transport system substrate-binding protein
LKLILLFLLLSITLRAATVKVLVEHWPPWEIAYDENRTKVEGGLAVELTQELLNRLNLQMELETVPWKRALSNLEKGYADLIPFIAKSPEREQYILFSEPVYEDPIILVYSSDKFDDFSWNNLDDLDNRVVGTVRGYTYGEAWNSKVNSQTIITDESVSDLVCLKKLLAGRTDFALQFYSVLMNLKDEISDYDKIKYSLKPLRKNVLRFGVSKKSFLASQLNEINEELRKMKEDGTLRKILQEYYID